MKNDVGIDLENIVYYRGNTHYFVMTALRKSLLDKGVILEDKEDRKMLLHPNNINKDKLHEYAISAAQYSTKHFSTALPTKEFALDARGNPDCAIFDFTNLYSARNASMVKVPDKISQRVDYSAHLKDKFNRSLRFRFAKATSSS